MKLLLSYISLFFIFITFSCKHKSVNCGIDCPSEEELIFQTAFNNITISDISDQWKAFHGIDTAFNVKNDWDELNNHPFIGEFKINMEDGNSTQRGVEITTDPTNASNNVMRFYIKEPHIHEVNKKKSRVQADINSNQCIHEFYQKVDIYLHPDMKYLQEWDNTFYWLSIFEFWNNANWTREKFPFRVTVNIIKPDEGKVNALYFHAKGDVNKHIGKWVPQWQVTNYAVAVPIGEWFTAELYIKEGNDKTGEFYLSIITKSKGKEVVFDVHNYTQHPKETCPDGFTDIHPLKFYTSEDLTNYMRNADKKLEIYWDNWSMYANKRP